MTTLKDVAKLAGVSIATVSYVINESKTVTLETRLKVMAAIKELNYIPNNSARKLRESQHNEICVVFPHIDDPYYSEILQGIIQCAEENGYTVNVAFSYNQAQKEATIIQDFIGRNINGIIIVTCQASNTTFFQNTLIRYNIPSTFIDRLPKGLDVNFITFDNYSTIYSLTDTLLKRGYEHLSIITGPSELLSEKDCICAFTDAHASLTKEYSKEDLYICDMTKEGAFCTLVKALKKKTPQVIISSSETITIGIIEALSLYHIKIPDDILVITLGIECWNSSNYYPGTLHTSRRAFSLGREATELLIKNIENPTFFETKIIYNKDPFSNELYDFPSPRISLKRKKPSRTLKVLATNLPTVHALELVSEDFCSTHDIAITFEYLSLSDLFNTIYFDTQLKECNHDIYLFDVSWLSYLVQENCFMDLTDFIQSDTFDRSHIFEKNLSNTYYQGRYYGLPIIGGTHLLFYRKDIFEDITTQRLFKKQHHLPLRPPKTWTEFNGIAKFFTKEFNDSSPTTYGCGIAGAVREELFLEIMVRLWSFGGGLYDKNNRLILNSPANAKALESMLQSCQFTSSNPFKTSNEKSFQEFCNGDIPMLLSFTEYASELKSLLSSSETANIGYSNIPGNTPANVGWQLGVNQSTPNYEIIKEYFQWICNKNTSYYMTILDGQSVLDYPYNNHELLKLYPWLTLTEHGIENSHSRLYPYKKGPLNTPPYMVESVVCNVFHDIYLRNTPIQEALDQGQQKMLYLFQ